MISRIYKVSRDKDTNTMAIDLAKLFSNTQESRRHLVEIKDFYSDQPNPYMTEEEERQAPSLALGNFFFLGHTDNNTFGGASVENFAAHFDQPFESKEKKLFQKKKPFSHEHKMEVRDIYLFGCEAGLADPGKNNAFAQRLANDLYRRGFVNAKVHAVAYEKKSLGESMYVEVIWDAAPGDKKTQQGFISAHSVDETTVSEVALLRHIKENAREERSREEAERQIKHKYAVAKARRKAIIDAASPLEFLKWAENTFVANETYRERNERIQQDLGYRDRQKRKSVIEQLKALKDETSELAKRNVLLKLLEALQTNYAATVEEVCNLYKNEYKELITVSIMGVRHTPQSKTLALLEQFSQGRIQPLPSTEVEPMPSDEEFDEEKPLINAHSSVRSEGSGTRHRPGLFPPPPANVGNLIPAQLRSEIESLYELLEDEISLLQDRMENACFGFFIGYEINTKAAKRDCLADLKNAKSLDELQAKAKVALDDRRINRGFRNTCTNEWGKSRVTDLLQNIIQNPHKEANNQPKFGNR